MGPRPLSESGKTNPKGLCQWNFYLAWGPLMEKKTETYGGIVHHGGEIHSGILDQKPIIHPGKKKSHVSKETHKNLISSIGNKKR
jgi:hypothetical protein